MDEAKSAKELLIRPRTSGDLAQAAAALVAVHEEDGYPVEGVGRPEAWLSPPGLMAAWVAESSGLIVGHVAVSGNGGQTATLERLFVHPVARGRRAAERLILTAEGFVSARQASLKLEVLSKDRAAIRLYRRMGWKEVGRHVHRLASGESYSALSFEAPGCRAGESA
ncbi:GNAT family N-acetyltransferase [Streptomyces fungicidicus]|uniref:GNAT family N-acetyltransferase n=1 Tax=Streptomyces fungicidicus TaxID=68203 RepID=A0ACC7Y3T8_9ACTN|nr:GNAT family N-acetyltransferase [Streptomyces fungicidicus]